MERLLGHEGEFHLAAQAQQEQMVYWKIEAT